MTTAEYINENIRWIAPIAVTAIGSLAYYLSKKGDNKSSAPANTTIESKHNLTVNNTITTTPPTQDTQPARQKKSDSEVKQNSKILFIDDDKKFRFVSQLRRGGWNSVVQVADIKRMEQEELIESDLVFCDIQGVGKILGFEDEGLGLALAIKQKYPDKKLIIYSALETYNAFTPGFRVADDILKKNAEFYEFEKAALDLLK